MAFRKTQAHVVRFFHPDSLSTAHHMTYNSESNQLAILKRLVCAEDTSDSGLIEICAVGHNRNPVVLKRLFVSCEQHSLLENLAWGPDGRLFSCGHNSCLNEHEISSTAGIKSVTVGGGVVWCIATDANRENIACGSDDGTISVFSLGQSSEFISFRKVIGKCATRVLSILWTTEATSARKRIIAGSIDFITIWSLKKGTCLDKLDVKQENHPLGDAIVWSLAVCGNYLISGDSNGYTSFWDLSQRVNIRSIKSHEADVLTVTADADGRVYSSGVDPAVCCFQINDDSVDMVNRQKIHRNDVKSLVIGPKGDLMSAGNGCFFIQWKGNSKKTTLSFMDFRSNIHTFGSSVMFNYQKSLELYDLSSKQEPVKSLVVNSKRCILSSAFDSSFVVYRTLDKLFVLKRSPDHTAVEKVEHDFSESPNSIDHFILFPESLLIVCHEKAVIMKLPDGHVSHEIIMPAAVYHCFSIGPKAVFVTVGGSIVVLDMDSFEMSEMRPLEEYVVDHAVHRKDINSFWFLTAHKKIISYNLSSPHISTSVNIGGHYRQSLYQGMTLCQSSLLIYSNDFFMSLAKEGCAVRSTSPAFRHIVKLGAEGKNVIIVELSSKELHQMLPSKFDGRSTQPFMK